MDPVRIPNHAQQAIARLPTQFTQSVALQALVSALTVPQQTVEGTLFDLLTKRHIGTAEGPQLDNIGLVLDAPRNNLSDADYRVALRGRASILGNSGEPETLISTYVKIWSASLVVLLELGPSTVQLSAQTDADPLSLTFDAQVRLAMASAAPAGVQVILEVAPTGGLLLADQSQADANGNGPQLATGGLADLSQVDAFGNGPIGAGGLGRIVP